MFYLGLGLDFLDDYNYFSSEFHYINIYSLEFFIFYIDILI